jgi:hypothetical protein
LTVDERELCLRGGLLERTQQVGVFVAGLFGRPELQSLGDSVDRIRGGQVDQEHPEPAVV